MNRKNLQKCPILLFLFANFGLFAQESAALPVYHFGADMPFSACLQMRMSEGSEPFDSVRHRPFEAFDSVRFSQYCVDHSGTIWMRFRLHNHRDSTPVLRYFCVGGHLYGELIQLYKDTIKVKSGGFEAPRSRDWVQGGGVYYYKIWVPPSDSITCYFKMQLRRGVNTYPTIPTLHGERKYLSDLANNDVRSDIAIITVCFFLALFFGLQFLYNRYRAYIWYAAYLAAFGLFFLHHHEIDAGNPLLLAHLPRLLSANEVLYVLPIFFCYIHFADALFELGRTSKRLHYLLKGIYMVAGVIFAVWITKEIFNFPIHHAVEIAVFTFMGLSSVWLLWHLHRYPHLSERLVFSGSLVMFGLASLTQLLPFTLRHQLFGDEQMILLKIGVALEILFFAPAIGIRIRRLEQEKSAALQLRLRIAHDLHDEVGSTLSSISIMSETVSRGLTGIADREQLDKIGDRTREAMLSIGDIVWGVNPENDAMQQVVDRMKAFAVEILEGRDIMLHFEAEPAVNEVLLSLEKRKDFYLLFKEAINNIAKHSGAEKVWVSVQLRQHRLFLSIRDDGRGFEPATVQRGTGLDSMQRRAALLGGVFSLKSTPDAGTQISIEFSIT